LARTTDSLQELFRLPPLTQLATSCKSVPRFFTRKVLGSNPRARTKNAKISRKLLHCFKCSQLTRKVLGSISYRDCSGCRYFSHIQNNRQPLAKASHAFSPRARTGVFILSARRESFAFFGRGL